MTYQENDAPVGAPSAALRLSEMEDLYQKIRQTLRAMIDAMGAPDGATPNQTIAKLDQLTAAHLKVVAAEDAFHEHIGQSADHDAIDYDVIRADIGGRLDRIRASLALCGISGGAE